MLRMDFPAMTFLASKRGPAATNFGTAKSTGKPVTEAQPLRTAASAPQVNNLGPAEFDSANPPEQPEGLPQGVRNCDLQAQYSLRFVQSKAGGEDVEGPSSLGSGNGCDSDLHRPAKIVGRPEEDRYAVTSCAEPLLFRAK